MRLKIISRAPSVIRSLDKANNMEEQSKNPERQMAETNIKGG